MGARGQSWPVDATWAAPAGAVALFLVPLLVFAVLAAHVAGRGTVVFDQPVMMWVHSATTPWLTDVMAAVTQLGGPVLRAVGAVLAVALWLVGRWRDAAFVVIAQVGSSQLNVVLKSVFERTRPDFWQHLTVENTPSFPSGHSMASMTIAAVVVVLTWGTRHRWTALAAAVVYVLLIGASRIYLGVHFPSDVLGAWCLAVLWVGAVAVVLWPLARWLRRAAPPDALS